MAQTTYTFASDTGRVSGTLVDILQPATSAGADAGPDLRLDATVRSLERMIEATASARTGVISVSASSRYRDLSPRLVERLLELVSRFNLETRRTQAAAEREFTEERLRQARQELLAAERRLAAFMQRNRDFSYSPTLTFEQERLSADLSAQRQLLTTLTQAYEQARIEEVRDTPVITVIEPPVRPVRPERRFLIFRAVGGLVAGATLGLVIVLVRELIGRARREGGGEYDDFATAWDSARQDLRRPWRPLGRVFRRG
jgi:uncharacterized protein involved in exopolysaccharide biosynthesis